MAELNYRLQRAPLTCGSMRVFGRTPQLGTFWTELKDLVRPCHLITPSCLLGHAIIVLNEAHPDEGIVFWLTAPERGSESPRQKSHGGGRLQRKDDGQRGSDIGIASEGC